MAELTARMDRAEQASTAAHAEAAQLRQDDEARRWQGRWARLRAAWRGE
jgi:hypothetical protein